MVVVLILKKESSFLMFYKILRLKQWFRRKREARAFHRGSEYARKLTGIKAKIYNKRRRHEKIQIKKTIRAHEERNVKQRAPNVIPDGAVPAYLLDRADEKQAKILSNMVKQKRKEKAEKYSVPLPRVRGISEEEIFKVIKTGKSKKKSWKRLITKATFVGEGFTRKPVKYEIIEVNVSEMGLVTSGGKVIWGKYAQITNNPEND
ncbi:unnamed protein product, partial [Pneumocystis jirovecii]